MKTLFLLAAGLAAGYLYGFRDAQVNDQPLQHRIAERVVSRTGGASRTRVGNDVDTRMAGAER